MKKKELIAASVLTALLAFMDISGLPCSLFLNIQVLDITPVYWTLMLNFVIIGIIAFFTLKYLCPGWELGLHRKGIAAGLREYGIIGAAVGIISGIAFFIGLQPFDYKPSFWKVLIEGIIYYFGVAFIEELYVRGLLLNCIEKLLIHHKNRTMIAVIFSSAIFGLGHIWGVLGQPLLVIIAKIVWTVAMGFYFGTVYKKTNNLWVPIILHFIIDICALPYCFSTVQGYSNVSLYIIVPTYIILGGYSLRLQAGKQQCL